MDLDLLWLSPSETLQSNKDVIKVISLYNSQDLFRSRVLCHFFYKVSKSHLFDVISPSVDAPEVQLGWNS